MSSTINSVSRVRILQFVAPVLIVAAVVLVFHGALEGGFVNWDDTHYVTRNDHIKVSSFDDVIWFFTHSYYWSYIPLAMLSHAADYALWGTDPWGHHLTSLILHALNAVWVYILGLTLSSTMVGRNGKSSGNGAALAPVVGATVASLLYSLHPLRVESVAWVSDRKDLLCAFFIFPLLISYLRSSTSAATRAGRGWYAVAVALHFCALLSKAVALMVPLLLIAIDLYRTGWPRAHAQWVTMFRNKIPFFVLSFLIGLIGMASVPAVKISFIVLNLSPIQRVLLPFYSFLFPLGKTVWPSMLSPIYDYPSTLVMGIWAVVFFALTGFFIVAFRTGHRAPLSAWICYVIISLPTAAYFASGIQPTADRYTYIATVPIFLLAGGWAAAQWNRHRPPVRLVRGLVLVAMVALATVLGGLSVRQVAIWKDPIALWQRGVAVVPMSPWVNNNLGDGLLGGGFLDEAIMAFSLAIEVDSAYVDAHNNLGVAYLMKQDWKRGLASLERALELLDRGEPTAGSVVDVLINIGNARWELGDRDGAIRMFRRALEIRSVFPEGYYALGRVLREQGDSVRALRALIVAAQQGDTAAQSMLLKEGRSWEGAK